MIDLSFTSSIGNIVYDEKDITFELDQSSISALDELPFLVDSVKLTIVDTGITNRLKMLAPLFKNVRGIKEFCINYIGRKATTIHRQFLSKQAGIGELVILGNIKYIYREFFNGMKINNLRICSQLDVFPNIPFEGHFRLLIIPIRLMKYHDLDNYPHYTEGDMCLMFNLVRDPENKKCIVERISKDNHEYQKCIEYF